MTEPAPPPIPMVTTAGSAVVPAVPDEARLSLTLAARERSADHALVEVRKRSAALEALLDGLGVDASRRTTTRLNVREEREYEKQRWLSKGFVASLQIAVKLDDPEPLGWLMTEAVDAAEATIAGPWWRVKLDNPAHAEACREAALDARRKAEAYADALGARLGPIVRVAEPHTGPAAHGPEIAMRPAAPEPQATAGAAGGPPNVDVQPGTIDVRAAVEVTFALET